MSALQTLDENSRILAGSYKLAKLPHLSSQLNNATLLKPHQLFDNPTHSLTWGVSERRKFMPSLPHITVEDGFLRSVGLGKSNTPPMSLIFDDEGIYYDASTPSRLERLIAHNKKNGDIIALFNKLRLTKYNTEPDKPLNFKTHKEIILIVDQVCGDRSIKGAEGHFTTMVQKARENHPNGLLLLKTHPDVLAGKARGILSERVAELNLTPLEENISSHALLDVVSHVYTVSSGLGFEALLRGVQVHCFASPFYAGYGLTRDYAPTPARREPASLEQLANATLCQYACYFDPVFGHHLSPFEGLERLARWRDYNLDAGTHFHAIGFSRWKQGYTRTMIERHNVKIDFVPLKVSMKAKAGSVTPLVWGKKVKGEAALKLKAHHGALTTMEDGFIRGRGLGSNFHRPLSLVLDKTGIYFDATQGNDLVELLKITQLTPAMLERAENIKNILVSQQISKYNLGATHPFKADEKFHLVIGQVEDDASIEFGTTNIRNNSDLLREVRHHHPLEIIVYKQHPDVSSGNRKGKLKAEVEPLANHILLEGDSIALFPATQMLHTMTSLAGFEALLRGVPVTTYGQPFYAGMGLTQEAIKTINSSVTINTLLHASFINYPRYYDPNTGISIEIEEALKILSNNNKNLNIREFSLFKRTLNYILKSILKR